MTKGRNGKKFVKIHDKKMSEHMASNYGKKLCQEIMARNCVKNMTEYAMEK